MPAHKKIPKPQICQICGKPVRSEYSKETVCGKCRSKLPKCGVCRAVMAPEYGFKESFGRKVGKYKICTGCDFELNKKGFLHISTERGGLYLLPSGNTTKKYPRTN